MKNILIAFLLLAAPVFSFGQEESSEPPKTSSKWAVQAMVQHQDFSLQNELVVGQLGVSHQVGLRPVFGLGGQRFFYKNPKKKGFISSQISFHNNLYLHDWWNGKVGLGYERQLFGTAFLSLRMEIGIARVKDSDPQYILQDGKWVYVRSAASPSWFMQWGPRMDIGYRISTGEYPVDVVANGQLIALMHDWGMLPYYALGLGVRVGL